MAPPVSSRLERLQTLLEQDPSNSFLSYGLAQELAGLGRLNDAAAQYQQLIARHPDYCAAYYHGAQTLRQMGRTDEARSLFQQGIAAATRAGDLHAQSEMEAALAELGS